MGLASIISRFPELVNECPYSCPLGRDSSRFYNQTDGRHQVRSIEPFLSREIRGLIPLQQKIQAPSPFLPSSTIMAPTIARIVRYESPDSDGSYEGVPGSTPSPAKNPPPGLLPIAECQSRLRRSLRHIPLKMFQQWRGGTIRKYLSLLVLQIKNNDKSHQKIYKDIMVKLCNKTNKPDGDEFKAFWLHHAEPLTMRQRLHLVEAGWEDLAAWTYPRAEGGNTDFDEEWAYMKSADSHAMEELSEMQYIWRQRLLLIRVEGFTQDDIGNWKMKLDMNPGVTQWEGRRCEKWITRRIHGWTDYIMRAIEPYPTAQAESIFTDNAPSARGPRPLRNLHQDRRHPLPAPNSRQSRPRPTTKG